MKTSTLVRKAYAILIALSCVLSVLPVSVSAEDEPKPADPEQTEEVTPEEPEGDIAPEITEPETVVLPDAEETEKPEEEKEPEVVEIPAEDAEPEVVEIPEESTEPQEPEISSGEPETVEVPSEEGSEEPPLLLVENTGTLLEGTNVSWNIDGTTLTISGTGDMPDFAGFTEAPWYGQTVYSLVIEEGVTSVGNYSFRGHKFGDSAGIYKWFTSVSLPSTLTRIGDHAFYHCGFTTLTIPENVETIGIRAFEEDQKCTYVDIQSHKITDLPEGCFRAMTKLQSIHIPSSVKTVGIAAFYLCGQNLSSATELKVYIDNIESWLNIDFDESQYEIDNTTYANILRHENAHLYINNQKLTTLDIPEGVTEIKPYAFMYDRQFDNIVIPTTLEKVGKNAFVWDSLLNSVYISDMEKFLSIDFESKLISTSQLGDYYGRLYLNGELVTDVTVPEGLTELKANALYGFRYIQSVTIPDSVTVIGEHALAGMAGLKTLTLPNHPMTVRQYAFSGTNNITRLNIGTIENWRSSTFAGGSFPLAYSTSGADVYSNGVKVDDLVIPEGETDISGSYYTGWHLNSISFPSTAKTIGSKAFKNSGNLASVVIPDGVTSIGSEAFSGAVIQSLTLPSTLTSIGNDAFDSVSASGTVQIDTLPDWVQISFENLKANPTWNGAKLMIHGQELTGDIIIADGTKNISKYAFYKKGLTSVTIPSSVNSIGDYAFYENTSLDSVSIREGAALIGTYAFANCTSLSSVSIPETMDTIGSAAFDSCTSLERIRIPSSVGSINAYAFRGCSQITRVDITDIGAFSSIGFGSDTANPLYYGAKLYENNQLVTEVVIPDNVTQISGYAFINDTDLTTVTIPTSVTAIGAGAFSGCTNLANVIYGGTETTRNLISIGSYNDPLNTAVWTYGNEGTVETGSCGEYLEWSVDVNGILVITGEGDMYDYGWHNTPWYNYKDMIVKVVLPEGITRIGEYAFHDCTAITEFTLPGTVTYVGSNAFNGVGVMDVTYTGFESDWLNLKENGIAYSNDALINANIIVSVARGSVTDTITWDIHADNEFLYLSGTGAMPEYDSVESVPWYPYRDRIKAVNLGKDIDTISHTGFDALESTWTFLIEEGSPYSAWYTPDYYCVETEDGRWDVGVSFIKNNIVEYFKPGTSNTYPWKLIAVPDDITGFADDIFTAERPVDLILFYGTYEQWPELNFGNGNEEIKDAAVTYFGPSETPILMEGIAGENAVWQLQYDEEDVGSLIFSGTGAIRDRDVWSSDISDVPQWFMAAAMDPGIRYIILEEGIERLGNYCLDEMPEVTSITLPSTLTEIGTVAFMYFPNLAQIKVAEGNTSFRTDEAGALFDYDMTRLLIYPAGQTETQYTVPETVLTIEQNAFESAQFQKLVLPPYMTELPEYTLAGARNMTSVILPRNLQIIDPDAFAGCRSIQSQDLVLYFPGTINDLENMTIIDKPESTQEISRGRIVFNHCGEDLTWKVEDDTLYIMGTGDMWNFRDMYEVDSSGNNTHIDSIRPGMLASAFTAGLMNVLGNSDKEIEFGGDAPWRGQNYSTVIISEGVTSIGNAAFQDSNSVYTIMIPSTVTKIGVDAFANCENLYMFTVENENPAFTVSDDILFTKDMTDLVCYPSSRLQGCEEYSVPDTVTKIRSGAFVRPRVGIIYLPDTITEIETNAFIRLDGYVDAVKYEGTYAALRNAAGHVDLNHDLYNYIHFIKCGDNLYWDYDADTKTLVITGIGDMWDFTVDGIDIQDGSQEQWTLRSNTVTNFGSIAPWLGELWHYYNWGDFINVSLPDGLTRIGNYAFCTSECNYEHIFIPATVAEIGTGALAAERVNFIEVDSENPYYRVGDNSGIYDKDMTVLIKLPYNENDTAYMMPETVTEIAPLAFYGTSNMEELYFPRGLASIDDYAFHRWRANGSNIYYPGTLYEWEQIYKGIDVERSLSTCNIIFGNELIDFDYSYNDGVLTISGIGNLPAYETPEEAPWAQYAETTHTIVLNRGIANITANAFTNFTNLDTLDLPRYLTEIDAQGLPSNINHIYYRGPVDDYKSNRLEDSLLAFAGAVEFPNCGDDLTWTLDNGTLTIHGTGDMWEDSGAWHLESMIDDVTALRFDDTVTGISKTPFIQMPNLSDVVIGKGIEHIDANAWADSHELTEFKVAEGNSYYAASDGILFSSDFKTLVAYPSGKAGTEYTIAEGVEEIGAAAFAGKLFDRGFGTYLTSITIPKSLRAVGENAFYGDTWDSDTGYGHELKLQKVYYTGTMLEWEDFTQGLTDYYDYNTNALIQCINNSSYCSGYPIFTKAGDRISWAIEGDTLVITGTGPMWDFYDRSSVIYSPRPDMLTASTSVPVYTAKSFGDSVPWNPNTNDLSEIHHVIISEGITHIGNYAFEGFSNLATVSLPLSLCTVGQGALNAWTEEQVMIFYPGSEDDRNANLTIIPSNVILENGRWAYGAHRITLKHSYGCYFNVQGDNDGYLIPIMDFDHVPEGVQLHVHLGVSLGYTLNPGKEEEFIITTGNEDIVLDADDFVTKDPALVAIDKLLIENTLPSSEFLYPWSVSEDDRLYLCNIIDNARLDFEELTAELLVDLLSETPEEEAALIENEVWEDAIIHYYDIRAAVSPSAYGEIPLDRIDSPITVPIELNGSLSDILRDGGECKIIRVIDGVMEEVPYTVSDDFSSLTIETDQFGIYGVAVKAPCKHELVKTEAVEPTCETDGNIEYWSCIHCDKHFSDEDGNDPITEWIIPALGHDWGEWTVTTEPACTEAGEETRICARCLQKETRPIDALGHDLVKTEAVEATCETAGNTEYWTCERCGKFFSDEAGEHEIAENSWIVPAFGHDWGEWTVITAPTCTEAGTEQRICNNDPSHVETRTIEAFGHDLVKTEAVEATCETAGNTEYWTCERCGKFFSDEEGLHEIEENSWIVPALGHDWGEWTVITAPTCTEEGEEQRICNNDPGHVETREIPASGHDWGEWTVVTVPTCTEPGEGKRICNNDPSHVETKTIDAFGHVLVKTEAVEATCETAGNTEYWTCERCGKFFSDKAGEHEIEKDSWITEALGHAYGKPVYTWSDDKSSVHAKVVCAHDETHVIEETVNTTSVTTAETCDTDGSIVYTAVFTKEPFTEQTETVIIPAYGHAYEFSAWNWAEDYSSASVTFICAHNSEHVLTVDADIEIDETKPTAAVPGNIEYTATVEYDDAVYTDVKNEEIPVESPTVVTVTIDTATGKPSVVWETRQCAVKYQLYRSTEQDGRYTRIANISGTNWLDTAAGAGIEYFYKVRCVGTDNLTGKFSAIVSATAIPARPTGITAKNYAATGNIHVSWDDMDDADKYQLYRSTSSGGTYTKIATTDVAEYIDTTGEDGQTYYYKVRSMTENNVYSKFSSVKSVKCVETVLTLTAAVDTVTGSPKLSWNTAADLRYYQLFRADSEDGTYKKLGNMTATEKLDTAAEPGQTYWYKVRAIDTDSKAGSYSEPVSITAIPAQPTGIATKNSPATGNIRVSWDDMEDAYKYQVYRATSSSGTYTRIATTENTYFVDTTGESGQTYYYKVRSMTENKVYSKFSSKKSAKCSETVLTIKASTDTATGKPKLTWNTAAEIKYYQLYRADSEDGTYEKLGNMTSASRIDSTAETGQTYWYKVRSIDTNNKSGSYSEPVSIVCKPAKVTGLKVTNVSSTGKPKLTWTADEEADKYQVYYSTSETGTYKKLKETTGTSYTHTAAETGTTYWYKVRAVSENGTAGAFSTIAEGTAQ